MEEELEVSTSSSVKRGGVEFENPSSLFAYYFPYYLSYGMTYSQFWEEDSTLAVYYNEKQKIENKRRNQEMWVQGLYFQIAIGSTMDKNCKYPSEPFALTTEEQEEREENARRERAYAFMQAFMRGNNKNKEKEGT